MTGHSSFALIPTSAWSSNGPTVGRFCGQPRALTRAPREEALRGLLPAGAELHIDADIARAKESTARLDLGYVVSVALDAVSRVGQPSASQS
jgi:hypothetical protein